MKRAKITIVGSDNVGATLSQLAIIKRLGDVVLLDRTKININRTVLTPPSLPLLKRKD